MGPRSINPFDAAVVICLIVAIVAGFRSGLLRSLATIFGYVCAAPIAVAMTPYLSPVLAGQFQMPSAENWLAFSLIFLVAGVAFSALLRSAVGAIAGRDVGVADRLAGALLGAVRIGLLAVLMVVIFDRIIPAGRDPAFLADSKLRPILSIAGQQGLKSLPPEAEAYIDRLKREHGI